MPENAFITFIPSTLPEGTCYTNEQERFNGYTAQLVGYLPINFTTWNTGSSEPTVENRGLPWHKTNAGAPDYNYDFFNGQWVSLYWPPASSSLRMLWVGTLTALETFDGGEAGTVSDDTGPFWERDTDFTDKILIGAGTVAVNTNSSTLADGTSATDQVRGLYVIKRTGRKYRRGT